MEIGGIDILLPVAKSVSAVDGIFEAVRAFWPDALIEDAEAIGLYPIRDRAAFSRFKDCREFFVYRDGDAATAWGLHGQQLEHQNSMVHFLIGDRSDPEQRVTAVVGSPCAEMNAFLQRLKKALNPEPERHDC